MFANRGSRATLTRLVGALMSFVMLPGISAAAPSSIGEQTNTVASTETTSSSDGPAASYVRRAVSGALLAAGTIPGLELETSVLDTATGEYVESTNTQRPMLSASLSKVLLVTDIIDRRRHEGLDVSESDIDLVRRALGPSDDLAMNHLWTRFDGPGAAARVSNRLLLAGTIAPIDESQWGAMTITASDIAKLYLHISTMPPSDRSIVLGALTAAPPLAADGFDQRFGLMALPTQGSAVKQGWMCCYGPTSYLHSSGFTGVNNRWIVVLLSRQLVHADWQDERHDMTLLADAVRTALDEIPTT